MKNLNIDIFLEKLKNSGIINSVMRNFLIGTNIRTRLIFSFLIISLLPISFIGVFSFISTYNDMESKATDYNLKMTMQIDNNINYLFSNYMDKFQRIANNNVILAYLYNFQYNKDRNSDVGMDTLRQTLASIIGPGEGIDSVEICAKNEARFYYSLPISKGSANDSRLISDTYKTESAIWKVTRKEIEDNEKIYVILSKKMRIEFDKDVLGYVFMSLKREYIDEVCKNNTRGTKQYVIITDENGYIISHPDEGKVMQKLDSNIMEKITQIDKQKQKEEPENHKEDDVKIFKVNSKDGILLVAYNTLKINNWKVITAVPYSYLMKSTIDKGLVTLGVMLLCIIVSLVISLAVTESISAPVRKLLVSMDKAGRGDLDVKIEEGDIKDARDEHLMLAAGFNEMVSKLKNLIDDVYQSRIKEQELEFLKKEAELNALQQQINPHFLYNTLEAIFWTAQLKGDDDISEMVTALGNFFRTSINKGLEYITIEDEVKNVQNYVYLQKIRFNDRFTVKWGIAYEICKYKIIKLILQPIIENAIIHGIENLESGGLIIINGFKSGDTIVFEVTDNGVGMSQEEVENLEAYINNPVKDANRSVGVKNVNQRIKLYFGDKYGVKISSELGKGTKVTLVVPAIINELQITLQSDVEDVN